MPFERFKATSGVKEATAIARDSFRDFPPLENGKFTEDQLHIKLHWGQDPLAKRFVLPGKIREAYLKRWHEQTGRISPSLQEIKLLDDPLKRKELRRQLRPFPGLVMTYLGHQASENQLTIDLGVGNYGQSSIIADRRFQLQFPQFEELFKSLPQGLGLINLAETADGYIVFGQRAANMLNPGYITAMGAIPNISDQDIRDFVQQKRTQESTTALSIPGSQIFNLMRADLIEADELNLEDASVFKTVQLMGAFRDNIMGWFILPFASRLKATTEEIEQSFLKAGNEHRNLIFVKSDPASILSFITTRPNVYPSTLGVCRLYLENFYPSTAASFSDYRKP